MPSSIRSKWEKAYNNQFSLKTFEDWKKILVLKILMKHSIIFTIMISIKTLFHILKKIEKGMQNNISKITNINI